MRDPASTTFAVTTLVLSPDLNTGDEKRERLTNKSHLPLLMCRGCGHFQEAESFEATEPLQSDCEECGGAEFVDPSDRF